MGIPLYFKKLSHEFVDIISHCKPEGHVSRLFLDFNCAVHYCSNQIKQENRKYTDDQFEHKLINECTKYITRLKEFVNPTDLIYVSIDGVVPMAKITQQRKRRFFSDFKNKDSTEWNSNGITPGTLFMQKLIKGLNVFKDSCDFDIHIDADRGEGEHKICHYIRNTEIPTGLDIIYGLDADMILLSMLSKHADQTYLLREHVKDHKVLIYMSIQNTKNQIYTQFSNMILDKTSSMEFMIQCYICITFFLGNDFLPSLSHISLRSNGISKLLEGYKEIYSKLNAHILIDNKLSVDLNYDFLKELLMFLSKSEDVDFNAQEEVYYQTSQSFKMKNDIENYPITNKFPKVINSHKAGWRQNYYYYLFSNSCDNSVINMSCMRYVQGLKWLIKYYFKQETEWYWFYPYNYSPTIMDLSNFTLDTNENKIILENNYSTEITDVDQLTMVLPPSSINILPKKEYRDIMTKVSLGYVHNFPKDFHICTFMKYKLHECGSQGLFLDEPMFVNKILNKN
jgi:5'-3' exonuclease